MNRTKLLSSMAFFISTTLFLGGCGDLNFKEEKKNKNRVEEKAISKTLPLSWDEDPDSYFVDLSQFEDLKGFEVRSDKKVVLLGEITELLDKKLYLRDGEQTVLLTFSERVEDYKVNVPKDYVVNRESKDQVFDPSLPKYEFFQGRLFLENVTVFTKGKPLNIDNLEIISQDSEIRSFPQEERAKVGKNGIDGSKATIKSKSGRGKLLISTRGQIGGTGVQPKRNPQILPRADKGRPGKEFCSENPRTGSESCNCQRQPGNGLNGKRGVKGLPAAKGLKGGNSGVIYVEFQEKSEIDLIIDTIPAEGGSPSYPGLGGVGQLGGEPGYKPSSCNSADFGEDGPEGPLGNEGEEGSPGSLDIQCLKLNGYIAPACFKEGA